MLTQKEMKQKFAGHGPMSGMPLYAIASNGEHGRVLSVGPKWVTIMKPGGEDVKVSSNSIVSANH